MKRKGLTLVEIIISLALLMSLCFFLLGNVSQVYTMIINTKTVTERTFATVDVMENEIERVRAVVSADSFNIENNPLEKLEVKKLFGIDDDDFVFDVYPVWASMKEGEGLVLYTVLAPGEIPTFPVPAIGRPNAYFKGTDSSTGTDQYGLSWEVDSAESGNVSITENAEHFLSNQYQWYVSRQGYNTIYFNKGDFDSLMPRFPADYTEVRGATTKNLTIHSGNLDDLRGRHLVLEVTPVAKSGKRGTSVITEPIFIHGLPELPESNLLTVLLDGGFWDRTKIESSRLAQWDNYGIGNPAKSTGDENPIISYGEINEFIEPDSNVKLPIYGQYLTLKNGNEMVIDNSDGNATGAVTVFAVARSTHTSPFLRGDQWALGLDGFKTDFGDPEDIGAKKSTWSVFGGMAGHDTLQHSVNKEIKYGIGGNVVSTLFSDSKYYIGPDNSVETNDDGDTDIVEIIIYQEKLEDDEYMRVIEYLMSKYGID